MKKMQDQQIYEVNPHTMIILPYKAGGSLYSEVMELGSHSISKFTPFELIKTSCKYFGANYDGRRIHEALNNYKKSPTFVRDLVYSAFSLSHKGHGYSGLSPFITLFLFESIVCCIIFKN